MYVYKDNADLREEFVRQQELSQKIADRFQNLIRRWETRDELPAHRKTMIETDVKSEGGVSYLRERRRGASEAASAWRRAIDMLDGVNAEAAALFSDPATPSHIERVTDPNLIALMDESVRDTLEWKLAEVIVGKRP